ncbi:CDK-activating kinase assembly factor MAT1-domain-containing protein [Tribonema minus]|uniref:CDK-activating kinase assembly factor MAT1-domain-containing protein n=1 Tax=Tribonema minus TaxID=303371 RepID=A0A835Z320_9STRA|nr:CDK-activating kinase assembly factor MAT1-domain-containing protein [Tribonema minus]
MDEDVCSICKSEDKITQDKLLVNNLCGHKFCGSCCDREFSRKKVFQCPKCKKDVKRTGLTQKTLDELAVQKELTHRRRILKIFNKTEEDFETLLEYNNYLAEVEDLIYDLTNGVDVEACLAKIRAYEDAHREEIIQNQARDMDTQRVVEQTIAAHAQQEETRKHDKQAEAQRLRLKRRKMHAEAVEVALGEREAVTSTLMDVLVLGDGGGADGGGGAAPAGALLPGQRMLIQINAPLPQPILHSATKRLYENMPPRARAAARRDAGGAPSRADGMRRNWFEACGSLFDGGGAPVAQ